MAGRPNVLSDDRLNALRDLVAQRARGLAIRFSGGSFEEFFDGSMRALFESSLRSVGAHEGTVWLLDEERTYLVPRFNNGPYASSFVGHFRQSVRVGMISMVVATEQPICENDVHENQRQDKTLDRTLDVQTCAMLAVPLYFAGELRGVLSAVQLRAADSGEPPPPGFTQQHLEALNLTSSIFSRLIDHQLTTLALGLEEGA